MTTKILILDGHAEIYRDRLQPEFPTTEWVLAHGLSELPKDVSDIDVLISFAIELTDDFYQRATRLKWINVWQPASTMCCAAHRSGPRRS